MRIYIDADYKCHTQGGSETRVVDTDYFDGKCAAYIEGCRFVPEGETWVREDGEVFHGEMITAWKPYAELERAQADYELAVVTADRDKCLADMQELIDEVLGG